jgi:hypothetical protein
MDKLQEEILKWSETNEVSSKEQSKEIASKYLLKRYINKCKYCITKTRLSTRLLPPML